MAQRRVALTAGYGLSGRITIPAFANAMRASHSARACERDGKRELLARLQARRLPRAARRAVETVARRFDLGLTGAVASRPHLGGGRGIFGDVIAHGGAGRAVNQTFVLAGLRARSQAETDRSNACQS